MQYSPSSLDSVLQHLAAGALLDRISPSVNQQVAKSNLLQQRPSIHIFPLTKTLNKSKLVAATSVSWPSWWNLDPEGDWSGALVY